MSRLAIWSALGLLIGTSAALAQPYTIKIKENREGDVAHVKKSETTLTKVVITDAGGGILADQSETKGDAMEYKETILKRAAGKPATRLMREYAKAQSQKNETTEDWGLQGKTVVIEEKADKYHFAFKNGDPVDGTAARALLREFSKKSEPDKELDKLILPQKPVNVGDSWKLQMRKIIAELSKEGNLSLSADKSTGKGTLVKAYKKDGRQFGEMHFIIEIPVATVGKGKETLTFAAGAKIHLNLTLDGCIDGSTETASMKMKMTMRGNASTQAAPGATVALDVVVDATQVQNEVTKKE